MRTWTNPVWIGVWAREEGRQTYRSTHSKRNPPLRRQHDASRRLHRVSRDRTAHEPGEEDSGRILGEESAFQRAGAIPPRRLQPGVTGSQSAYRGEEDLGTLSE